MFPPALQELRENDYTDAVFCADLQALLASALQLQDVQYCSAQSRCKLLLTTAVVSEQPL
jgi:hypothetical protein